MSLPFGIIMDKETDKIKLKHILIDRVEQLIASKTSLEAALAETKHDFDKYYRWYHDETALTTKLRKQVKLLTEQLDEAGIVVEATGYEEANA